MSRGQTDTVIESSPSKDAEDRLSQVFELLLAETPDKESVNHVRARPIEYTDQE